MADTPLAPADVKISIVNVEDGEENNRAEPVKLQTDMGWTGAGPWTYQLLSEPFLSSELARLSCAKLHSLDSGDRVYSVSLQPCPNPESRSQDRFIIQNWSLTDGAWTFAAVFDGHAGHDTVDYVSGELPKRVRDALSSRVVANGRPDPKTISKLLAESVAGLDHEISQAVKDLFPGGVKELKELSDDTIRNVINDQARGGVNAAKVARCMRGTTVLITVTDPSKDNLWVASLGDCVAVLGEFNVPTLGQGSSSENSPPPGARVKVLSEFHNGQNQDEVERIRSEHPGENEVILRDRVLGAIAVTRAVGDHLFKLPVEYSTRVFMNAEERFTISTPLQEILPRIITPPYLSAVPAVRHVVLKEAFKQPINGHVRSHGGDVAPTDTSSNNTHHIERHQFLILCSDGLSDLYHGDEDPEILWAEIVGQAMREASVGDPVNPALSLLRDSLGGSDATVVSRMLTVEMTSRWMDDTTIIVVPL